MKTTLETMTPTRARELLARNEGNRALRGSHVDYFVEQIKSGNWQVTHQGIAIAKDGRLLDGQHRLMAISLAQKPVQIQVSTGLDADVYKVTDCGLKRTAYDRIHLVDNKAQNALICKIISSYVRYGLRYREAIPVSMIEDEFLRYTKSWLWVTAQFCKPMRVYGRIGILAAIGIYHVVDAGKAAEFADGYRTGENLTGASPVLTLRRSVECSADAINDYWRAMAAIKAHLHGRPLAKIHLAIEDVLGNQNSCRLIQSRTAKGIKAAKTRNLRESA